MIRRFAILVGILIVSFAAQAQNLIVKRADVPQYPQLAIAARLGGTLRFHVAVKHGSVISVKPNSENSANLRILQDAAITNIKSWSFYEDSATFDTEFIFEISQREVPVAQNQRVEMTLPTSVKLIAYPVKPTVNYGVQQK